MVANGNVSGRALARVDLVHALTRAKSARAKARSLTLEKSVTMYYSRFTFQSQLL
jgi:hypothetical protein